MVLEVITEQDIAKRSYWMEEITRLSGNFGVDSERVEQEIREEIRATGLPSLMAHLRL